jgi:hypothetical protein
MDLEDLETRSVRSSEDWRQGDIIVIEPIVGESETSPPSVGVVINADCDLAHNKLDGVLAYLPIYTYAEYLESFWAPEFIKISLNNSIRSALEKIGVAESDAEKESLIRWIDQTDLEDVLSTMETKLKGKVAKDLTRIKISLNSSISYLDRFSLLSQEEAKPEDYLKRHLDAAYKQMGEGHFFINDINHLPDIGYVVRMRRIYTISTENCFKSQSEQQAKSDGKSVTARRIARLSSLYQFKIAQLFAHQYSRIGLPDEISNLNQTVMKLIAETLGKIQK